MDEETSRRLQVLENLVKNQASRLVALQEQVRAAGEKSMRASHESIDTKELVYETVLKLRDENRELFEIERQNRKRELRRIMKTNSRGTGQLAAWGAGICVIVIVGGLVAAKIIDAVAFAPTVIALLGAIAALVYREQRVSKKEQEDDEREERNSGSIHPGAVLRDTMPAGREPARLDRYNLPRQP
jgi:hypothetical protein